MMKRRPQQILLNVVVLLIAHLLTACALLGPGATEVPPTATESAPVPLDQPVPTPVPAEEQDVPVPETSEPEAAEPTPASGYAPGQVILNETVSTDQAAGGIEWSFDAKVGQVVRIDAQVNGGTPAFEIRLFDRFNNRLAHVESASGAALAAISEITLPYLGAYRVAFFPMGGTGSITTTVTALDAPSGGGSVEVGQSYETALNAPNAYHTYSVDLLEGDVVSFEARAAANGLPDTQLALYGPDGRLMAEADDVSTPENLDAVLSHFIAPLTGTYVAIVDNYSGTTGTYAFAVTSETIPPVAEGEPDIVVGRDYRIQLFEGSNLSLSFDAHIGDVLKVETFGLAPNLDIDMRLYSPFGQAIAYALDSEPGEPENLNEVQIPYTGRYVLELVPFGQGEATFRLLALTQEELSGGGSFGSDLHGTREGHVNASGVFHYYQFAGNAGNIVDISILSQSIVGELDLGMALLAPDGQQIAFADNQDALGSMDPHLQDYRLTQTGAYTIVVYTFDGEARGTYELSFTRDEE